MSYHIAVPVNIDRCNGCGLCASICKRKAIEMKDNVAVIDTDLCKNCGRCVSACPYSAIVEKQRGIAILVGGRDGKETRLGEVITEFVSEDEALRVTRRCLGNVGDLMSCYYSR